MTPPTPVPVTQEDREAAELLVEELASEKRTSRAYGKAAAAFARHRLAECERCAKVADRSYNGRSAQKNAAKISGTRKEVRDFESMMIEASMIAAAIRENAHVG